MSNLQEQIEVLSGRMKYLSESAEYSSITIRLSPDDQNEPIQIAGWHPTGTAKDAIESLVEGLMTVKKITVI